MTTHLGLNRLTLSPPAAGLIRRAKIALTAVAFVAAVLLVAVVSWPLKVLILLVFVRGLFASDVMAMRNAERHRGGRRYLQRCAPRGGNARHAADSIRRTLTRDAQRTRR
jgi:UPF0716 family protein affecting phage T7 exclusion